MAEIMLTSLIPKEMKTIATQTGDLIEFFGHMSKTKTIHMYYSPRFEDYIICLSFSNNKKYIIKRDEWRKLRKYIPHIDHVLGR